MEKFQKIHYLNYVRRGIGLSIAEVTDNIHTIGVDKPVYGYPTFPLTAKAV